MANPVYSIGLSALHTARASLQTTSNNVANANTPGYTRQRVELVANPGQYIGGMWMGAGVSAEQVTRSYDSYLESNVRSTSARSSYYASMNEQMAPLDQMLSDSEAGLAPFMERFQSALSDLAQRPSDTAARQLVLANARGLAERFNGVAAQIDSARSDAEGRLNDSVNAINQATTQLVELNRQITDQSFGPTGVVAKNDLLDQRDNLLRGIAEQVGINVVMQDDGSANVFMSNGQALVVGHQAFKVSVVPSTANPDVTTVGVEAGPGRTVSFRPQDLVGSGELGATLNFRDNALNDLDERIDALAATLAAEFNRQHQQGVDLTGTAGTELFSLGAPRAMTTSGTARLSVTVPTSSPAAGSFPAGPYDLSATAAGFELRAAGDSALLASSAVLPMNALGVTIDIDSGTVASGDTFRIETSAGAAAAMRVQIADPRRLAAAQGPTLTGAGDNRNALTMSGLMRDKLAEAGTATLQQSYAGLVGSFATQVAEVKTVGRAQDALFTQAKAAQQEVSGVNLEEEAANLIRFQQAFQAASQVMKTAGSLFDEVLAIARG